MVSCQDCAHLCLLFLPLAGECNPCIFEYIYLARPDSVLNNISVYNFQLSLGTRLAKKIKKQGWQIDVVVPVPDGSRPSAIEVRSSSATCICVQQQRSYRDKCAVPDVQ